MLGQPSDAVTGAQKTTDLVRSRGEGGTVSDLELPDTERTSLSLERQVAQVKAQRLIKALGGAW